MSPGELEQGYAVPSHFSSPTVNKCPFRCLFGALLCSLLETVPFKMASKHSAAALSAPRRRNTMMCLREKTRTLEKLPSEGVSSSAVGFEFDIDARFPLRSNGSVFAVALRKTTLVNKENQLPCGCGKPASRSAAMSVPIRSGHLFCCHS